MRLEFNINYSEYDDDWYNSDKMPFVCGRAIRALGGKELERQGKAVLVVSDRKISGRKRIVIERRAKDNIWGSFYSLYIEGSRHYVQFFDRMYRHLDKVMGKQVGTKTFYARIDPAK